MNLNLYLSDIIPGNVGIWPFTVRVMVLCFAYLLITTFSICIYVIPQLKKLSHEEKTELNLRQVFEEKQKQWVNLYQDHHELAKRKEAFDTILNKLPSKIEMPELLENISEKGVTKGLHFYLIKPLEEKKYDFYAELPIEIFVAGGYHQLAEFISNISALRHLITMGDFDINVLKEGTNGLSHGDDGIKKSQRCMLEMKAVVKTYRYYSEYEKAAMKVEEKREP